MCCHSALEYCVLVFVAKQTQDSWLMLTVATSKQVSFHIGVIFVC